MSGIAEQLAALERARAETLAALSALSEEDLERPAPWRGGRLDVRFLLLQLADADDERRVRLIGALGRVGWRPSRAQLILRDAARVRGRLLATLVAAPDGALDVPPAPGEWSLREVIGHILTTEQRYTIHSRHAADRAMRAAAGEEPGPLRPPDALLPSLSAAGPPGDVVALRHALVTAQVATWEALTGVGDAWLNAPTDWSGIALDLRFRLHRFAAHERQHLVQVYKTLRGVGVQQTEAQMILGEAEQARAALVALTIGLPNVVAARSVDGAASALDLLRDAEQGEQALVASIRIACQSRDRDGRA